MNRNGNGRVGTHFVFPDFYENCEEISGTSTRLATVGARFPVENWFVDGRKTFVSRYLRVFFLLFSVVPIAVNILFVIIKYMHV